MTKSFLVVWQNDWWQIITLYKVQGPNLKWEYRIGKTLSRVFYFVFFILFIYLSYSFIFSLLSICYNCNLYYFFSLHIRFYFGFFQPFFLPFMFWLRLQFSPFLLLYLISQLVLVFTYPSHIRLYLGFFIPVFLPFMFLLQLHLLEIA